MKKMFIGIDPSLQSTGLFFFTRSGQFGKYHYDKPVYAQIDTKPKDFPNSINRCLYIASLIVQLIKQKIDNDTIVQLVVCQDYFVGRQQGAVVQLAQLGTMIRYKILLQGYPLCIVPPKTIKKFVTGNGNAKKQQMMKIVEEKWNYKASTDNLADACGMSHFAEFITELWAENIVLDKKQIDGFEKYVTKKCLIKIEQ